MLGLFPFSGAAFVFRVPVETGGPDQDFVWDRTVLMLVHKRLEGCKVVWSKSRMA